MDFFLIECLDQTHLLYFKELVGSDESKSSVNIRINHISGEE